MILNAIAAVGAVWWAAIAALSGLGWYSAIMLVNRSKAAPAADPPEPQSPDDSEEDMPFVSLLRPCKGAEAHLDECLDSAFRLRYPARCFEIFMSVADAHDEAIPVIRDVQSRHPHIQSRLIIGEEPVGPNPKVCNLIRPYAQMNEAAQFFWVLDSNASVSSYALREMVNVFADRRVNLVHQLPVCVQDSAESTLPPSATAKAGYPSSLSPSPSPSPSPPRGRARPRRLWRPRLGALLEEMYMTTLHAKMYAAINTVNVAPCVNGKSNMFRLKAFRAAMGPEGLGSLANFIAEDHLLGVRLWHGRGSHRLVGAVRQSIPARLTFMEYAARRMRWIRIRKYMTTAATLVEPLTDCFASGMVGAASLARLVPHTGYFAVPFFIVHCCVWAAMDLLMFTTLQQPTRLGSLHNHVRWLLAWALRESVALPIWLVAMLGDDTVTWRSQSFKIHSDMTVELVGSSC